MLFASAYHAYIMKSEYTITCYHLITERVLNHPSMTSQSHSLLPFQREIYANKVGSGRTNFRLANDLICNATNDTNNTISSVTVVSIVRIITDNFRERNLIYGI